MLKRIKEALTRPIKSRRGVALLMAVFTFVLVSGISMELLEETHVEYISSSQGVNRLKAYYAAKAGVEISLLRILIYKKALSLAGDNLGSNASILDEIWRFPFIWPPVVPDTATKVEKDLITGAAEDSLLGGAIATQISSEGSKIDINDLASPAKLLEKTTREQLLRILNNRVQSDETFGDIYREGDFDEVLNHIADWVDEDNDSRQGGDEKGYYRDFEEDSIPPNQSFKTLEELHMVAGMTDEIFDALASHITVYGVAGIQVNTADKEVLMSIDPGMTEEIADEIIKRRSDPDLGGPFADLKSFLSFLEGEGLTLDQEELEEEGVPLIFDAELNFRIKSTGLQGQTTREIVAIVYDFDRVKDRVADLVKKQDEDGEDAEARKALEEKCKDEEGDKKYECLCDEETDTDKKNACIEDEKKKAEAAKKTAEKKAKPPKGRPNVVFWFEE